MQCVTGKHNGHKMSNMKEVISNLRTTFREEIHTKLDAIQANGKQIEEGLTTFDLSVTSVIHALTAEGTEIKATIDRHIEKMIATLKEKANNSWRMQKRSKKRKRKYENPEMTLLPFNICRN